MKNYESPLYRSHVNVFTVWNVTMTFHTSFADLYFNTLTIFTYGTFVLSMLTEPNLAGSTITRLALDLSGPTNVVTGPGRILFPFGDGENFICNVVRNMICTYNTWPHIVFLPKYRVFIFWRRRELMWKYDLLKNTSWFRFFSCSIAIVKRSELEWQTLTYNVY